MAARTFIPTPIDPAELAAMVETMNEFITERGELGEELAISNVDLMDRFRPYIKSRHPQIQVKLGIMKATMAAVMENSAITRTESPVVYHGFTIDGTQYVPKVKRSKKESKEPKVKVRAQRQLIFGHFLQFFRAQCVVGTGTVSNVELFDRFGAYLVTANQTPILPSDLRKVMDEMMELYPVTRIESPLGYAGFQFGN